MGNVIYKMCRATKWHYPFAPSKLDMCLSTFGSLQICSVCIYRILEKNCRTPKCWQISEVINYDCHSEAANHSKCMVSASQHASITVTVMVEKVDVLPIVANDPSPLPVYLHCFCVLEQPILTRCLATCLRGARLYCAKPKAGSYVMVGHKDISMLILT